MKIDLQFLNCFLLVIPLLVWNLVLGPRLTDPRITSDAHSPKWLLLGENITRILAFTLPLLLPLQWKDAWGKAGLAVYAGGTMIYFASWLPLMLAPGSGWSQSPAGLLAPRLTPFLSLLGIALIDASWLYGLISAVFIALHTWHGLQNLSAAGNPAGRTDSGRYSREG